MFGVSKVRDLFFSAVSFFFINQSLLFTFFNLQALSVVSPHTVRKSTPRMKCLTEEDLALPVLALRI